MRIQSGTSTQRTLISFFSFLKIFYLFIFRERGREEERVGEKHECVGDTSIGYLLHSPNWGPGL